ncbi:hypothetical protein Dimus_006723 [Dionaea muscipula]
MSSTRTATITQTITLAENASPNPPQTAVPETLILRLNRKKKKVTWKEGTVDNEFLGKKSSKKCCIFHKQKSFDEDDSDEEEDHPGHTKDEGGSCSKDCVA